MTVVEKRWGREEIHVNTILYCAKTLHVSGGQRCSLHHHAKKDETFLVQSGDCTIEVNGEVRRLGVGDQVRIPPGTKHRFGSRDGCSLLEVSTHHDDVDVVRHEPSGPIPEGWCVGGISAVDADRLRSLRKKFRDERIVLACGCFDLLHAGHVDFLSRAAAMGRILVVAINSDESVRRLKGPDRPVVPAEQRAAMLWALRFVYHVVVFDTDDPRCVSESLKPDIVVKGDDWRGRPVPESEGAILAILPDQVSQRTTAIVDRLRSEATG